MKKLLSSSINKKLFTASINRNIFKASIKVKPIEEGQRGEDR
jgi:hypothetical protein